MVEDFMSEELKPLRESQARRRKVRNELEKSLSLLSHSGKNRTQEHTEEGTR